MSSAVLGIGSEISRAKQLVDSFRARKSRLESELVDAKFAQQRKPINSWGMSDVAVGGIIGGLAGMVVGLTALSTVFAGGM